MDSPGLKFIAGERVFLAEFSDAYHTRIPNVILEALGAGQLKKIRLNEYFPLVKRIETFHNSDFRSACRKVREYAARSDSKEMRDSLGRVPTKESFAHAGLIFQHEFSGETKNVVFCPFCETWERVLFTGGGVDPWMYHKLDCPFALVFGPYKHQPPTLESLVEDVESAQKDASYFLSRLATFYNWPRYLRFDVKKMAEEGMFYTGLGDKLSCIGGCCVLSPLRKGEKLSKRLSADCSVKKALMM